MAFVTGAAKSAFAGVAAAHTAEREQQPRRKVAIPVRRSQSTTNLVCSAAHARKLEFGSKNAQFQATRAAIGTEKEVPLQAWETVPVQETDLPARPQYKRVTSQADAAPFQVDLAYDVEPYVAVRVAAEGPTAASAHVTSESATWVGSNARKFAFNSKHVELTSYRTYVPEELVVAPPKLWDAPARPQAKAAPIHFGSASSASYTPEHPDELDVYTHVRISADAPSAPSYTASSWTGAHVRRMAFGSKHSELHTADALHTMNAAPAPAPVSLQGLSARPEVKHTRANRASAPSVLPLEELSAYTQVRIGKDTIAESSPQTNLSSASWMSAHARKFAFAGKATELHSHWNATVQAQPVEDKSTAAAPKAAEAEYTVPDKYTAPPPVVPRVQITSPVKTTGSMSAAVMLWVNAQRRSVPAARAKTNYVPAAPPALPAPPVTRKAAPKPAATPLVIPLELTVSQVEKAVPQPEVKSLEIKVSSPKGQDKKNDDDDDDNWGQPYYLMPKETAAPAEPVRAVVAAAATSPTGSPRKQPSPIYAEPDWSNMTTSMKSQPVQTRSPLEAISRGTFRLLFRNSSKPAMES